MASATWDPGDADRVFDQNESSSFLVPVTAGAHTYELRLRASPGTTTNYRDLRLTALYVRSSL